VGLLRDITSRKEAEQLRLEREVSQRNTLIREVHHRIKNNLQGVVGLLRQHTRKGSVSEAVIEYAISQLHSVSLVHGLQSHDQHQTISISALVTAVCKSANSMTGIEIHPYIDKLTSTQVIVNEEHAVALALVINELVFNAIKHSNNADHPNVHVELRIRSDKVDLTILNSEATLPASFNFKHGRGLGTGLKLIKSLLPRAGAQLDIVQVEQGVKAILTLSSPTIIKNDEQHGQRQHRIA
jgi:two-component sensor histidine kinase